MNNALTIAIPFYTSLSYLEKAITSVKAQTSAEWRLIVSDDQSPNLGAEELVASFNDPRIIYSRSEQNLGMARNWSRCLDLAETDLVTLLHEDDELLPDYVQFMLDAAHQYRDAVAIFCGAKIIDEQGRPKFSFPDWYKGFLLPKHGASLNLHGEPALAALLRGNFIMCPTLCYRKSRLNGQRFDARWKMVLDLEFTTRLLLAGQTLIGFPRVKAYAYRRHSSNATSAYTASLLRFDEEIRLYELLEKEAGDRGWREARTLAAKKRIILMNLGYCFVADILKLRWNKVGSKIRLMRRLISRKDALS